MVKEFFQGNQARLYAQMKENSLLILFIGMEVCKSVATPRTIDDVEDTMRHSFMAFSS